VSSIADKFKKFMPQGGNPVVVGGDSACRLISCQYAPLASV